MNRKKRSNRGGSEELFTLSGLVCLVLLAPTFLLSDTLIVARGAYHVS